MWELHFYLIMSIYGDFHGTVGNTPSSSTCTCCIWHNTNEA
jgi:hypothetical protein